MSTVGESLWETCVENWVLVVLTVFMVFWEAVYYKVFGIDGYWDGTMEAIEGMLFSTVD